MKLQQYRVVIIGTKSPNMLSEVTSQLSKYSFEIESISSLRPGHSFIALLMIETIEDKYAIENCLSDIVHLHGLQLIINLCPQEKCKFIKSNVFMRIRGKYNTGVKSRIISALTQAGLDIHGLETDTYKNNGERFFIINIKGLTESGLEDLVIIINKLEQENMKVAISDARELLP